MQPEMGQIMVGSLHCRVVCSLYYHSTWTSSTRIKLFVEMLKISKLLLSTREQFFVEGKWRICKNIQEYFIFEHGIFKFDRLTCVGAALVLQV